MGAKVLVADKFESVGLDGLRSAGCEVVYQPEAGAKDLAAALAAADPAVLVVRSSKTPRAAIDAAPSLRGVIRAGAGYDNIDCPAAKARGVAVCNCPGMNAAAVAELVFAMLLALDRRVVEQTVELRAGRWNKKVYSVARGLAGTTLGVVGVGAIGREVIRRAKAFAMNVTAHSLNMNPDRALDLGVGYGGRNRAELLDMLRGCDAVTVHVAANAESEKMCDAAFFDAMKPGAAFINTSRGSVVDEPALLAAAAAKGLRIGADVFAGEPSGGEAPWTSPLAALPRFVGTHHVGASTEQAQLAVAHEVVRIVRLWAETGRWENRVV